MKLLVILSAQIVLIFALDLSFATNLGLWLLYFLPLLGTARLPSIRVTLFGAMLASALLVGVGFSKLGQAPWEEIFVPRVLAVYALGLTAVLLIRGKQFGSRAMDAVAAAAQQPRGQDEPRDIRDDVAAARQQLGGLAHELHAAFQAQNQETIARIQGEIENILARLGELLRSA